MSFSRNRIDARPQNSWTTQVGLRNVHNDTRGRPISGRWDSGKPWTPGQSAEGGKTTSAPAPDAANVNARQNLHKRIMSGAPLTAAMRKEANNLHVTDDQFNAAAEQAKTNARYTPAAPSSAPRSQGWASKATGAPAQPSAIQPTASAPPATNGLTPQITTSTGPGNAPLVNGRAINRLTGKPMGWLPGDDTPAPKFGKDIANANIATKGVAGATADYFRRSNQDAAQKMTANLNATGNPAPTPSLQQRMSPTPLPGKTWQQTAGINPPASPTAKAQPQFGTLPAKPAPAPITPIQTVPQKPATSNQTVTQPPAPAPVDPAIAALNTANKNAALLFSSGKPKAEAQAAAAATPSPSALPPMPAVAAEKPKPPVDPATAALNQANKSAALSFAQGRPQAAAAQLVAATPAAAPTKLPPMPPVAAESPRPATSPIDRAGQTAALNLSQRMQQPARTPEAPTPAPAPAPAAPPAKPSLTDTVKSLLPSLTGTMQPGEADKPTVSETIRRRTGSNWLSNRAQ